MGCNNSRTVKSAIVEKPKTSPTTSQDPIREYYTANETIMSKRIRELFQRYFSQQTSSVTVIDLKFINLSGAQLKSIEIIFPCFSQIKALNLWKTKLGNEGCIILSGILHKFQSLSFLSVADNRITFEGIQALTQKFEVLKELEILEMHVNPFNEDATRALTEKITVLSKLRIICLDECEMGGESLKEFIIALPGVKELERVSMDYNFFGETASSVLASVIYKLKKLKRFSAQHTGITPTIQESLRKLNPDILFSFT